MSIETSPNSAAFGFDSYRQGLTKREYFAIYALQAYLSTYDKDHAPSYESAAEHAVGYADALIDALNASPNRAGLTG